MTVPRWLDRLWLWAIGVSFVIFVPLWIALWVSRVGWLNVTLYTVALFFAGFYAGLPGGSGRR